MRPHLPLAALPTSAVAMFSGLIIVLLLCCLVWIFRAHIQLTGFLQQTLQAFRSFKGRKQALSMSLLFALLNTSFHISALWCMMRAFHVDIDPLTALFILTGGVAAASLTPTPGGLGGSEAGLTAGMIAYGIEPSLALVIALSYRLVSYWLPIIPGIFAFLLAQRRGLL
jgi:uncharacterized protein (TIRG00374 family)